MKLFWMDLVAGNNRLNYAIARQALILIIFLMPARVNAQHTPPLERVVTISFYQEKLDVVLLRLSKEAKFTFSYNPAIVDLNGTVSGTFVKKSVREILSQIFTGKIQFKEKGNYIILTKAATYPPKDSVIPVVITGYVSDEKTGEKISEVSIYDKKTFSAAVSNQYGFFKLRIEKPSEENYISINKKGYKDTVALIFNEGELFIEFTLTPERTVPDSLKENMLFSDSSRNEPVLAEEQSLPAEKEEVQKESRINMINIRDTLYRDFQVSFVPFIGTNHKLSGNVINDYSFNILGGYSLGTARAELGGLFNIDRGHVEQVQVAGLFNAVGGKMTGVQVAGVINMNNEHVVATQLAGTINFNLSGVRGIQAAGMMNLNGGESRGLQLAGTANIQIKDYHGSQVAGALNVATHKITGSQISGLMNFGRIVKGSQIGIINIADSIQGVPVGFISLVRKGYHKIEIAADEIFYTNLSFRTGVRQFYNIFTTGIKPDTFGDPVWTFGYGLGSAPRLTRWLFLNFDLTANHVDRGHLTPELSLLNKFYMGFDIQLARKFSVTFGATLNAYLTDRDISEYPALFTDYNPPLVSDRDIGNNTHMQMWWGGKVGIRFF